MVTQEESATGFFDCGWTLSCHGTAEEKGRVTSSVTEGRGGGCERSGSIADGRAQRLGRKVSAACNCDRIR